MFTISVSRINIPATQINRTNLKKKKKNPRVRYIFRLCGYIIYPFEARARVHRSRYKVAEPFKIRNITTWPEVRATRLYRVERVVEMRRASAALERRVLWLVHCARRESSRRRCNVHFFLSARLCELKSITIPSFMGLNITILVVFNGIRL